MSDNQNNEGGADSQGNEQPQQAGSAQYRLIEHIKSNKIDCALWATRLLTICFAIGYMIPIFGSSQSAYNKVLLANAATSALRLHQRLPSFQLSRAFLSQLFVEDSCHYLLYSFIFMYVSPVFLILVPVVSFAILHASSYSLKLLDLIGQNSCWSARFLISLIEFQATNILRVCSLSEIFSMPLAIIMVFIGKAGLMTPFIYYHFIVMRYMSRRNPYTRSMFTELRMSVEHLAYRCPPVLSKVLRFGISLVTRLAPQQQSAATQ
ncbi:TMEM33 family protein [Megaselia abdita]